MQEKVKADFGTISSAALIATASQSDAHTAVFNSEGMSTKANVSIMGNNTIAELLIENVGTGRGAWIIQGAPVGPGSPIWESKACWLSKTIAMQMPWMPESNVSTNGETVIVGSTLGTGKVLSLSQLNTSNTVTSCGDHAHRQVTE